MSSSWTLGRVLGGPVLTSGVALCGLACAVSGASAALVTAPQAASMTRVAAAPHRSVTSAEHDQERRSILGRVARVMHHDDQRPQHAEVQRRSDAVVASAPRRAQPVPPTATTTGAAVRRLAAPRRGVTELAPASSPTRGSVAGPTPRMVRAANLNMAGAGSKPSTVRALRSEAARDHAKRVALAESNRWAKRHPASR